MTERHGDRPDTPIDEPAPTVTSKWRSDEWIELDRRQNGGPPLDPRRVPSPTLTSAAIGKGVWVVRTGSNSMKHSRETSEIVPYERDITEPAPTVDTKAAGAWAITRPATTIVGSFCPDIVAAPGYRTSESRQNAEGSIKITEQDALVLQSFRPDYPLQGSRSKRFEQVGNAVPPVLAMHVVAAITGTPIPKEDDRAA